MIRHSIQLLLLILLGIAGIFLPFMPGEYDHAARSISAMVQLFAFSGLLLVLPGAFWLLHESRRQKKADAGAKYRLAAWLVSIPVALATSLGAFASQSRFLGFVALLAYAILFFINIPAAQGVKHVRKAGFSAVPLYLLIIPLILCFCRLTFIKQATAYSRSRVIGNSAILIRDIEEYKQRNGTYPLSLLSVWEDYDPGIISVQRYYYEPNGEAYNLYFEQFSPDPGAREFVMYNPLDQQEMTSHNQDLLRLSSAELDQQRGYFEMKSLPQKHWKVFRFD